LHLFRRFDVDGDCVFVPSSPADLSIGDRVKVSRHAGSTTSHAFVKYVGHLPGKVGPYVGLELENEGKCTVYAALGSQTGVAYTAYSICCIRLTDRHILPQGVFGETSGDESALR